MSTETEVQDPYEDFINSNEQNVTLFTSPGLYDTMDLDDWIATTKREFEGLLSFVPDTCVEHDSFPGWIWLVDGKPRAWLDWENGHGYDSGLVPAA